MNMPSPGENGVRASGDAGGDTARHRPTKPSRFGSASRGKRQLQVLLLCLVSFAARAELNEVSSNEAAQGWQLAQRIMDQKPPQNTTIAGILRIRDDAGTRFSVPIKCSIILSGPNWESIYEANWTNHAEILWIYHTAGEANRYCLETNQPVTSADNLADVEDLARRQRPLASAEIMAPFVGSDFCPADLGLEYFHWPEQKALKQEIHRSRGCTVLESTNPHPSPDGYARVISWIDSETLGIVEACAYDARGRTLKDFYPKDFKKVDGQWQVQTLVMENERTGSRSRMEFDLKK